MIRAALIACTLAVAAEATDLERLADAIRLVEGYRGVPGAMGEDGPYQIRAATWAQHMPGIPFARVVHERTARICARRHLTWLALRLEGRGVPASPFNLALCWNAGLARTLSGRAPERAYDYACRVQVLYSKSVHLSNLARHGLRLDDRTLALRPDEGVNCIVRAFIESRGLPAEKPAGLDKALGPLLGHAFPERGDFKNL